MTTTPRGKYRLPAGDAIFLRCFIVRYRLTHSPYSAWHHGTWILAGFSPELESSVKLIPYSADELYHAFRIGNNTPYSKKIHPRLNRYYYGIGYCGFLPGLDEL